MSYQPGQQVLSGVSSYLVPVDNGGAVTAALPMNGGTVTLNGATPVTVANAKVTAGSIIVFTLKTVGGTVGAAPVIETITAGTGFTVQGTASDTSVYNYAIIG
jgi:hypothetical protein